MVVKKSPKSKKINPYRIFQDWLFNVMPDPSFPEECLKGINKRAVLASLGKLDGVTIYMDKHFNNFDLMNLDDIEFYKFIRVNIIKKFKVGKWDLSFFKSEKKDKNLKELQKTFPYLKTSEIAAFMELVKDDDEVDNLYESLDMYKSKKKKLTNNAKKEIMSRKKERLIENNIPVSFGDLLKQFNKLPVYDIGGDCYQQPDDE